MTEDDVLEPGTVEVKFVSEARGSPPPLRRFMPVSQVALLREGQVIDLWGSNPRAGDQLAASVLNKPQRITSIRHRVYVGPARDETYNGTADLTLVTVYTEKAFAHD